MKYIILGRTPTGNEIHKAVLNTLNYARRHVANANVKRNDKT